MWFFIFQASKYCDLNACPQMSLPLHFYLGHTLPTQHNSLIPCDCKSLGDSTPFMSVLEQTSGSVRQHLEAYYKLRISDPTPDPKLDLYFIFFTNFTEVYLTNKSCT